MISEEIMGSPQLLGSVSLRDVTTKPYIYNILRGIMYLSYILVSGIREIYLHNLLVYVDD